MNVAYTKQAWNNKPATDTPISAERLSHIEDGVEAAHTAAAAAVQPSSLATVATTGAYADLTGKPAIPDVSGKEDKANRNTVNGYAGLDASGKVAAAQLPSYVDDVLEFVNLDVFPATGETGKIYVARDNGRIYRWSGAAYVEIAASPGSTDVVPEGVSNLYYTQARADARVAAGVAGKANTTDLAAVAFSGKYEDLDGAPSGGGGGPVAWNDVIGKPTAFPPSAHTHEIGEVEDLASALASVASSIPDALADLDTSVTGSQLDALKAAVDGFDAANTVFIFHDYTASAGDVIFAGNIDDFNIDLDSPASNGDHVTIFYLMAGPFNTSATVTFFDFLTQQEQTVTLSLGSKHDIYYLEDVDVPGVFPEPLSGWFGMITPTSFFNDNMSPSP